MTKNLPPEQTGNADDVRVERVSSLLRRYPDLAYEEISEIKAFLRQGSIMAIGRVTGNEAIAPNLAAFRSDHSLSTGPSPRQLVATGLIVSALLVLITVVLWDVGA